MSYSSIRLGFFLVISRVAEELVRSLLLLLQALEILLMSAIYRERSS